MELKEFIKKYGEKYSEGLSINLEKEPFKWFLASVLFGARITEKIAINTYREFDKAHITTPKKIIAAGWDKLVEVLDRGGYVRYDFKTADKLLEVSNNIIKKYGKFENIHKEALDSKDLEKRLKELGKGIGVITASIFLRELRGIWSKADVELKGLAKEALRNLGLKDAKEYCKRENIDLVNFETALVRLGKNFCRKGKCKECYLKEICKIKVVISPKRTTLK
jgi:endonuclease III